MGCGASKTQHADDANRHVKKKTDTHSAGVQQANNEQEVTDHKPRNNNTADKKTDKHTLDGQEVKEASERSNSVPENQTIMDSENTKGNLDNMTSITPGHMEKKELPGTVALNSSAPPPSIARKKEKKVEPPPESCEVVLNEMKMQHEKIISCQLPKVNAEGMFSETIHSAVAYFCHAYFDFKKIPDIQLPEITEGRKKAAKILLDCKLLDIITELYISYFGMNWISPEGKKIVQVFRSLENTALIMVNYSDSSDEVAITLAGMPGLLELLREKLAEYAQPHLENDLERFKRMQLKHILSMVHNMTMRDSTITLFQQHNFTEVLQPYLSSEDPKIVVVSLASLAGIIDEKQAEMINTRPETVKELFKWLENGMDDKLRRYNGWSCAESSLAIRQLALNDANKKQLVELGALELLVKLARTGDIREQYESIQAIWALTFDEDNRKKICSDTDLGVIELLNDLKTSDEKSIRRGCEGALWNLGKSSSQLEKGRKEGEKAREDKKLKASEGHIMISYQWADQNMLKRVRDGLKNAGYQVWMDIDQMGGSTLQAMAEAVENARIVLISMSHRYKNSPNCRAEAEYAYQKQKKIIPLKLERGYIPDGWLGFMAGTKLFFEFTEKYPFEMKLNGLVREIQNWEASQDIISPEVALITNSVPSQPVDMTDHAPVASVPTALKVTTTSIRKWSGNDVQNWINKNDLKSCNLGSITGPEIAFLMKMQVEAPEFFYKTLQDTLGLKSLLSMTKFGWALNDLQTEART